jgi:hypothetical protein
VVDNSGRLGVGNSSPSYTVDATGNLRATTGALLNNVRLGVTAANEIDTTSGNLILDSTGGTVEITDNVTISGTTTMSDNLTMASTKLVRFNSAATTAAATIGYNNSTKSIDFTFNE